MFVLRFRAGSGIGLKFDPRDFPFSGGVFSQVREEEEDFRFREETADKKKLTQRAAGGRRKIVTFFFADPSRVVLPEVSCRRPEREKQALNYRVGSVKKIESFFIFEDILKS